MINDPLSEFLTLVEARGALSTGLDARGWWAMQVPAIGALKCNVVVRGECKLQVDERQWHLQQGDCFIVSPNLPFLIGTDLDQPPRAASDVYASTSEQQDALLDAGDGPTFRCIGGRMDLPPTADFLTETLEAVSILREGTAAASRIRWLVERLDAENSENLPGSAAMGAQIMQMIFIELIRSLPQDIARGSWVAALRDKRIGGALRAIHRDPGKDWTVSELAQLSHFSRSQFSARFVAAVGYTPMDYVFRWRMTLASVALKKTHTSVSIVAGDLGYTSESAFIHAFRRMYGITPRQASKPSRLKAEMGRNKAS